MAEYLQVTGQFFPLRRCPMKQVRGAVLVSLFAVILTASAQSTLSPKPAPERTQEIGYWIDPATDLMWAGKDNGRDLTWQKAMKYCRDLRLAGHSDWRLATLAEMRGIFDKNESTPGQGGEGKTLRPYAYHVRGNLFLTGNHWTSTRLLNSRGKPSGYAWRFDFLDGRAFDGDELSFSVNKRALCVRGSPK